MNLDHDIARAQRLADAAGAAIRPHFRSQVASERKADASRDSSCIRILPIGPVIGEAIRRIADESSVSSLFD